MSDSLAVAAAKWALMIERRLAVIEAALRLPPYPPPDTPDAQP